MATSLLSSRASCKSSEFFEISSSDAWLRDPKAPKTSSACPLALHFRKTLKNRIFLSSRSSATVESVVLHSVLISTIEASELTVVESDSRCTRTLLA